MASVFIRSTPGIPNVFCFENSSRFRCSVPCLEFSRKKMERYWRLHRLRGSLDDPCSHKPDKVSDLISFHLVASALITVTLVHICMVVTQLLPLVRFTFNCASRTRTETSRRRNTSGAPGQPSRYSQSTPSRHERKQRGFCRWLYLGVPM